MKTIQNILCGVCLIICLTSCSTTNYRLSSQATAERFVTHLAHKDLPRLETLSSTEAKRKLVLRKITSNDYFMNWLKGAYQKGYRLDTQDSLNKATVFVGFRGEDTRLKINMVHENQTWKIEDVGFWKW